MGQIAQQKEGLGLSDWPQRGGGAEEAEFFGKIGLISQIGRIIRSRKGAAGLI